MQREEARPRSIGRGMLRGGHTIRKDAAGTAQEGGEAGWAISERRMTSPGDREKSEEPGPLGLTVKGKHLTFNHRLSSQWASLVAQTVKNPPAMRETWV